MKKKLHILPSEKIKIYFFIILLISSCSENKPQKEEDPEKNIKTLTDSTVTSTSPIDSTNLITSNNLKQIVNYYPDSTIQETYFLDSEGQKQGVLIAYSPIGFVKYEISYVDGEKYGDMYTYDDKGVRYQYYFNINDSTSTSMRKYCKHGISFAEFKLKSNSTVLGGNHIEDTIIYSSNRFDLPFIEETIKKIDTLEYISKGAPLLINKDSLYSLCDKIIFLENSKDFNDLDYLLFEIGRKTGITPNIYSKADGISYNSELDFRDDIKNWKKRCYCD